MLKRTSGIDKLKINNLKINYEYYQIILTALLLEQKRLLITHFSNLHVEEHPETKNPV